MDELLDHLPGGFVAFADDGTVLAANATLLELLGYARDEVVGRPVEQLLAMGTRIFYQTHWFPLLSLHGRAEEVFLMLRSRAGENIGVLSYAQRRAGVPGGAYDCVLVRVRERARYEDELLRAKRAAEETAAQLEARTAEAELLRAQADEANQAKSAFLAAMSHELRTPLNAISGYLSILELEIPGPINEAQRAIVARIEQSSRHLLRLINEVLNLARIEAGHVDYQVRDADAAEIAAGILPMIEPQFAAKGIRFAVELDRAPRVRADIEKTQQILLNLLGNAVKFTPADGSVTLRAGPAAHDGGAVHLEVHDSGIGIPPEQLEAVFQPFVQVDAGRTRTAQGTGLGLAISRDLARGMGGELWAESTVGAGSTFTLRLPAAPD